MFVGTPELASLRRPEDVRIATEGLADQLQVNPSGVVVIGGGAVMLTAAAVGVEPPERAPAASLTVSVEPSAWLRMVGGESILVGARDQPPIARLAIGSTLVDMSSGWGDSSHEQLSEGAVLLDGIAAASLKEVYQQTVGSDELDDQLDAAFITALLHEKVLPQEFLQKHLDFIKSILPPDWEDVLDDSLLLIAANGLHIVDVTIDGGFYQGEVETEGVFSAYHGLGHSAEGLVELVRHAIQVNYEDIRQGRPPTFDTASIIAVLIAFSYHDAVLGHGRKAVNPKGYDEGRAAELAYQHVLSTGDHEQIVKIAKMVKVGIQASAFKEGGKGGQDIVPERGFLHVQEAVAGVDLQTLSLPRGVEEAFKVCGEDLMRLGLENKYQRALGRVLDAINLGRQEPIRFKKPEDMFHFVDMFGSRLVPGDEKGRTLREIFLERVFDNIGFIKPDGFQYPPGWTREDIAMRVLNASRLGALHARVASGEITVAQGYEIAKSYRHR